MPQPGSLGCLLSQEGSTTWSQQEQSYNQSTGSQWELRLGGGVHTDPLRQSGQNPCQHPGIFTYMLAYVQSYRHELMHLYP